MKEISGAAIAAELETVRDFAAEHVHCREETTFVVPPVFGALTYLAAADVVQTSYEILETDGDGVAVPRTVGMEKRE